MYCQFIFRTLLLGLMMFISFPLIQAQNLVVNGNFESGGPGVGFDGGSYTYLTAPYSGNTNPGEFGVTTNPQPMNTVNFPSVTDHTSGSGNMMVVDGTTTGGGQRFWRLGNVGNGVCGLTVGATYTFSYWIRSLSNNNPADIGIQFNNASNITLTTGSATAPAMAAGWQEVVYTFTPTNACVNIEMYDNNTNLVGNDFALDDISLTAPPKPLTISYSSSPISCFGANDGAIVGYGNGGILPYSVYTLSGTASASNSTGIFTSLAPGTYTVSVTDNASTTVSTTSITITQPSNLTLSGNTSICSGTSTTLSVSGGSNYSWTASPSDLSLTTPNSATPLVSPTQTTNYTVQSNNTTVQELIHNGNFSSGNVGFYSDYQYQNPTNPSGAQLTYGIVSNPQTWFNTFSSCTGMGGAGNMMVVDGSVYNSGNDRVWCQTVPVVPGKT